MKKLTAKEFLASDLSANFRAACARVQVFSAKDKGFITLEPSLRQARKWYRKEGLAYKEGRVT